MGPLTTSSKPLTLADVLLPECKASKLPFLLIRAPGDGAAQIARGSDPACSFILLPSLPPTCSLSAAELNTEAFWGGYFSWSRENSFRRPSSPNQSARQPPETTIICSHKFSPGAWRPREVFFFNLLSFLSLSLSLSLSHFYFCKLSFYFPCSLFKIPLEAKFVKPWVFFF